MHTKNKLEEARFFLNKVQETLSDSKINYFYLSAFLASWRSIPDVLLYDLAEHYGIADYYRKLENSTSFKTLTNEHSFQCAAKELKNYEALEFIKWWATRMREIHNLQLSSKRIEAVHKGLRPHPIIVSPFVTSTGFNLAGYVRYKKYVADMIGIMGKCQEGLALMEDMVNEADQKFDVSLE